MITGSLALKLPSAARFPQQNLFSFMIGSTSRKTLISLRRVTAGAPDFSSLGRIL